MTDIARELAKIIKPDPDRASDQDEKEYKRILAAVRRERTELIGALSSIAAESPADDPLLARLEALAQKKREIDQEVRLILAYAREFIRPGPYKLKLLAEAAGMSISGVRTAYDAQDKIIVSGRIGRSDTKYTVNTSPGDLVRIPAATVTKYGEKLPEHLRPMNRADQSPQDVEAGVMTTEPLS
ncbi:hypothetical protein [Planobispora rosea]|uniref:hypothetical protein n=1 Tax=Planobispora rosea TaxID=35762 RepID=UPI000A4593F0|nr:hypothetical protein [Planobispora rosea]